MQKYARIYDGHVVEFFETDGDISTMFHPDLIWVNVDSVSGIAEGWTAINVDGVWEFAPYIPPSEPLPVVAENKRMSLRESCSAAITRSSFQSNALGSVHNYDCRVVDQLNLKVRYDIASVTSTSEPLWASDGTRYQWKQHTASEIMGVMVDMNEHIKVAQVKLATKLAAVDAATTSADIVAIQW